MDKKALLDSLKTDLDASEQMRSNHEAKRQQWANEHDGKPYGNEEDGKSKIISRDIKKQSEWLHASLIAPFVSSTDIIKASPVTWEDKTAAKQNEIVLNTQFCRQFNRYNFMTKAVKVLDREGTVVVKTGWDYEYEDEEIEIEAIGIDEDGYEFITKETMTITKTTKSQPTAIVCRNEDIFIDPTCQDDIDNCQFVIHRYETDISTLKSDGRYKNLDKINVNLDSDSDATYSTEDTTRFRFEDDPRKKLLVYEYWGNYDVNEDGIAEPIICTWIDDTIIRLQSNPYPDKKPPFIITAFNSIPFQLFGESNAEILSDMQKVKTAILRGIIDNMAQSNNAQKGVRKGALDSRNLKLYKKKQNFEFNGSPNDFWDGSYNQIPGSAFDVLAMMDNNIESVTGVKSFSSGLNAGSLGNTATGARGTLDATSTRKLNLVRNIAENLIKPLLRKWMAYNSKFLGEEEIVRLTNDEFVEIKRDDLSGKIDIDIQVSTAEDNAAKSQELAFMLQTLGPSAEPHERRMIQAEIATLRGMPDLANSLLTYKPDPEVVKQQQAEHQIEMDRRRLENKKLEAEINGLYKSAIEDEADSAEKYSQAKHKIAQTKKLEAEISLIESKKDMQDLDFIKTDEQVNHQEALELKEADRISALDQMAFQINFGSKDEQIGVPSLA